MSSLERVRAHERRGKHGMVEVREYERPTGERGNIAFDFDGVLHEHRGYTWPPGGLDFSGIDKAHERGYSAAIVTANDPPLIARELKARGYHVALDPSNQTWYWTGGADGHTILVTGRKVDAKAYIDDKAVNHMFGDDWDHTLDQVQRLRAGQHPIEQGEDHVHFQHSTGPTGQESRLTSGMPAIRVWLTTPEEMELTNVRGYRRFERGKLENVRGYVNRRVRHGDAQITKSLRTAMGGGKKFHKLNGRFVDAGGNVHWGWYGGAGLLVHHTDDKNVTRYLLQKRSGGVMQGGTWSTPGGAIDKVGGLVETPVKTAFREAVEEWGPMPRDLTVTGVTTKSFGEAAKPGHWTYHTVHAETPQMFAPASLAKDKKGKWLNPAAEHGGESAGYGWFTPDEMTKLDLHPDFRETAIKHLGMPDVPPPKPKYKTGGYQQAGGYGFGWQGATGGHWGAEVYERGDRVTWRHQGQTVHGVVLHDDGKTPTVAVRSDAGAEVGVAWADLLHEGPGGTEQPPGPVYPPGTSLAQQAQAEKVGSSKQHYPKGDRVTWRYHGQTVHGEVLGNAIGEESSTQPVAYQIRSDDGVTVEVPWSGLRLEAEAEPHQHVAKPPTVIKGQSLTPAQKAKAKQPFPQAVQQSRFAEPAKPKGKSKGKSKEAKPAPAKAVKPPPPPPKGSVLARGSSSIHGYVMPGIQRQRPGSLTFLKTAQRVAQEKGKRYAAEKPPPGRNYPLRRARALRAEMERSTRSTYVR